MTFYLKQLACQFEYRRLIRLITLFSEHPSLRRPVERESFAAQFRQNLPVRTGKNCRLAFGFLLGARLKSCDRSNKNACGRILDKDNWKDAPKYMALVAIASKPAAAYAAS